ncbi:uncharacterized protein TNCV_163811 [Trichonephila clavipes]|nr:uncharacterized protein TNCV_163811 [Trichonephila clavipes]
MVANFKFREKSIIVKNPLCNTSGDRLITKTIARLRIDHYTGMKFDRDRRTYRNCDNCSYTELTAVNVFDCPAILAAVQEIEVLFSSLNLCVDNIEQIARTVIWARGTVGFSPIKDTAFEA